MKLFSKTLLFCLLILRSQAQIPLPEHPRPDFERKEWINLNGHWAFEFDKNDSGVQENWQSGKKKFQQRILVPFPWGSPLSEVKDEADIAWYARTIQVPATWRAKRTFVTIGASDWETTVFLDGKEIGKHQGGYTPFSFDLTPFIKYGKAQQLIIRADDKRRDFTLYGKQGYGNARGIWQTVYLEARAKNYIDYVHFSPDIDKNQVKVKVGLGEPSKKKLNISLVIHGKKLIVSSYPLPANQQELSFSVPIPQPTLWTLDNPYLYTAELQLSDGSAAKDEVKSYFGMRKISVMNLPNTDYPYISLNNKPLYLQLTLDQSYHPGGYYTFPSDQFMKDEILKARQIGLNGIRTHIKIDIPRKLYWADKLGVLVMSDLPNFWSEPIPAAREESERTLPEMIKRDFNHPSIFSWIIFNETWGLRSKKEEKGKEVSVYLPETQKWVVSMVEKAKSLDSTRLVEDNSICCGAGHTVTDLNSWHEYLPGWEWDDYLSKIVKNTYAGSTFHFENGYKQGNQPMFNSECGNVWGYDGSTGDVDWSWDYHRMMNTFRKYPKISGWLYTEHHDVMNEWNGYWRFDRSNKFTGLEEMLKGMSINDFHSPIYLSTGNEISKSVKPNEKVSFPLYISSMTDRTDLGNSLKLRVKVYGYDALGQAKNWQEFSKDIPYHPYINQALDSLQLIAPNEKAVVTVGLILEDSKGKVLHHNLVNLVVESPIPPEMTLLNGKKAIVLSQAPKSFTTANWSLKQWDVLDGLKVNGAGKGYFEYTFVVPKNATFENASFIAEVGAKELFVKDMNQEAMKNVDYMLGGKASPSQNPNSYPMTDEKLFPSEMTVSANGVFTQTIHLPDDPADHRGVLSWHYQPKVRKLNEAGSYGYRVEVMLPKEAIEKAKKTGTIVIRLATEGNTSGGIAIYGEKFGRYPINPTVLLIEK